MSKTSSLLIALFLVALGISGRLLPHTANITPVAAIAIFAAAYLGLGYSLVVFLMIMLVTDSIIGFYEWQIMLAVYGSFALSGAIGFFMRKRKSAPVIFLGTLASSVLFFLITNWAVWRFGGLYPRSWAGLGESYLMALPFFRNSLAGDLFYAGFLFGAFELSRHLARALRQNFSVKAERQPLPRF